MKNGRHVKKITCETVLGFKEEGIIRRCTNNKYNRDVNWSEQWQKQDLMREVIIFLKNIAIIRLKEGCICK